MSIQCANLHAFTQICIYTFKICTHICSFISSLSICTNFICLDLYICICIHVSICACDRKVLHTSGRRLSMLGVSSAMRTQCLRYSWRLQLCGFPFGDQVRSRALTLPAGVNTDRTLGTERFVAAAVWMTGCLQRVGPRKVHMKAVPQPRAPIYPLRDPKYHQIETIWPLIELHWGI